MHANNRPAPLIFVTGATGRQGGAVARHLLDHGFAVRALTRDPDKPAARALRDGGAQVVRGDLSAPASYRPALDGVHGVYAVQSFWETGYDGEIHQGTALADAARAADVQHFVYSSVGGADRDTGIPHFDSKWKIEQHLRAIGLPCTILRPVFFMNNWEMPALRDALRGGTLPQPLSPDTRLQQIATDDIGAFAALAFANPDPWLGRAVELAGDELTMTETAATFARVLGRDVRYQQVPWDRFEQAAGPETTVMYRWFEDVGYHADIPALRRERPELATLEQYLRQHPEVHAPIG